ncbi:hypothetical protein EBU71_22510 [bacterium]|nr:hypothetical protein [Candidatus Elulimicrobium humile]
MYYQDPVAPHRLPPVNQLFSSIGDKFARESAERRARASEMRQYGISQDTYDPMYENPLYAKVSQQRAEDALVEAELQGQGMLPKLILGLLFLGCLVAGIVYLTQEVSDSDPEKEEKRKNNSLIGGLLIAAAAIIAFIVFLMWRRARADEFQESIPEMLNQPAFNISTPRKSMYPKTLGPDALQMNPIRFVPRSSN